MGIPKPEDGSPLGQWKARRLIRNCVWLVGGLVIVYLLGLALEQSRENRNLVSTLKNQQSDFEDRMVKSLAGILLQVQSGEAAAAALGEQARITFEQAIASLKKSFPPEVVDRAVNTVTAPGSATTTTTTRKSSTTTTAAAGPPGATGPPGPAGPPAPTTTSSTTTTTTVRQCTLGLNVPGLARICL